MQNCKRMSNNLEEIPYFDSSRMELKRSHQWLTESSSSEQLSNKRQIVEFDGPWDNSLVSRHCLFDQANALHYRQSSPIGGRHFEEQINNVSEIGLPVVHTVHGSSFNVNQVSGYGNMPESMVQLYGQGNSRPVETGPSYNSSLSFGQTCNNVDKSFLLPGPLGGKGYGDHIGSFNHEGDGLVPISNTYEKGDGNVLSTLHPFENGVESFVLMGQSLQKADCNVFSTSSSYNNGQENFVSQPFRGNVSGNIFMTGSNENDANVLSGRCSPFMEGGEMAFMVTNQGRAEQNNDLMSHEVRSKTLSFGHYQKETTMGSSSVSVTNSYDNFSNDPASAKDPRHLEAEENISFEFTSPSSASPRVDNLPVPKSKTPKAAKKGPSNTFPSNVKSLLSTGMFDGVNVKYYSWSREQNLQGIIKGTGYLCGCGSCNLNKVLNAYEFEQHANCKTKHPNNHIYFENGKTVYGVVQELKNTPQEKLFDAIKTVTGSDINQKNFNAWKASYEVASLELQRIYGKDTVTSAS